MKVTLFTTLKTSIFKVSCKVKHLFYQNLTEEDQNFLGLSTSVFSNCYCWHQDQQILKKAGTFLGQNHLDFRYLQTNIWKCHFPTKTIQSSQTKGTKGVNSLTLPALQLEGQKDNKEWSVLPMVVMRQVCDTAGKYLCVSWAQANCFKSILQHWNWVINVNLTAGINTVMYILGLIHFMWFFYQAGLTVRVALVVQCYAPTPR